MSSVQPVPQSPPDWIPTGTAAGMLKPSTGYAFKHMHAHAERIAAAPEFRAKGLARTHGRFAFYDHLLLLILERKPALGRPIFKALFRSQPIRFILRFLDEQSALVDEVRMFAQLPILPFLQALGWRLTGASRTAAAVMVAALLCVLQAVDPTLATWAGGAGMAVGLAAIGIPHGALDAHLAGRTHSPQFYAAYLLSVGLVLALWWWAPLLALLAFLLYSAYHFGESEFADRPGGREIGPAALLAGIPLLAAMLLPHGPEVQSILVDMGVAQAAQWTLPPFFPSQTGWAAGLGLLAAGAWALGKRQLAGLATLFALGSMLTVWMSFGLYFILVHSAGGWGSLRRHFELDNRALFRKALPFNALSWLGLAGIFAGWFLGQTFTAHTLLAALFILIAGVSLPHIWVMHRFHTSQAAS